MAVYVIADLHLSTLESTNKSMEVFGARWQGYQEKLAKNWRALVEETDTIVIPGDISWAMSLEEAKSDLAFIHALPGKKIFLKGNHDFWWASMQKNLALLESEDLHSLSFLYHTARVCEHLILAGTRGWFCEDVTNPSLDPQDKKVIDREALRLEMSLKEAKALKEQNPSLEIVAFFHFPPLWNGVACEPFFDLMEQYGVRRCYFGHIHGSYHLPRTNTYRGIACTCIAADHLSFTPLHIAKEME